MVEFTIGVLVASAIDNEYFKVAPSLVTLTIYNVPDIPIALF